LPCALSSATNQSKPLTHTRAISQDERAPLTEIINTTFPVLLGILRGVLANPAAGATVGLTPSHYARLVLKVFWSSTFMGVPDALLADEQFSGWTAALHEMLTRLPPVVRRDCICCCLLPQ
jgi:hypothetical protein